MGKFIDLSGKRFGRLVVVERAEDRISKGGYHKSMWLCQCDCGNTTIVGSQELRNGDTKSCGCYCTESKRVRATKHGFSKEPLYCTWKGIIARCTNPNHKNYADYGGRGITICDEWKNSYPAFRTWALDNGYECGLTFDRIDTNGMYCPENCRLVDCVAQANNRRNNRTISYNGETHNIKWWSEHTGIKYGTLYHRIMSGWNIEDALKI